ncbi:MAG: hypothetical protein WCK02_12965 [Bacteroidota bacterium]
MQTTSTNAKNAISSVHAAMPSYSIAVAEREIAFAPITTLSSRILNGLKASDTSSQVIDSAKTIVRKIQGNRAKPKKTEEEKTALAAEGKPVKEISVSNQSFDSQLENLDKLIKLLSSIVTYTPNETELKVATLTILFNDLKAKNATVIAKTTPLSNARIARNEIFNNPKTGLVASASDAKAYIKSLYGASSPQYKQISKLAFKAIK